MKKYKLTMIDGSTEDVSAQNMLLSTDGLTAVFYDADGNLIAVAPLARTQIIVQIKE